MFKIGKLFHLTHVVNDLDAVDKWYDDVFACKRFYKDMKSSQDATRHSS
jgi:extradiol dioxygenase family protein